MTSGPVKQGPTRSSYLAVVLVATVVCVLALIAIPDFMRLEYKDTFEHTENNMRKISEAQGTSYKLSGKFSCSPELLKNGPRWDDYTYYWCDQVKYFGQSKQTALPPNFKTAFGPNYWNAFAVDDMDGDGFIDVWMVDSTGKIAHLQDDYIDCGAHIIFGINIVQLPYGQELVKALGGRECRPAFFKAK